MNNEKEGEQGAKAYIRSALTLHSRTANSCIKNPALKSCATVQRKNTLLVEYKQRHTANDFIDRRFGGTLDTALFFQAGTVQPLSPDLLCSEGDEALDESDRAIARFQKQRTKELAGMQEYAKCTAASSPT